MKRDIRYLTEKQLFSAALEELDLTIRVFEKLASDCKINGDEARAEAYSEATYNLRVIANIFFDKEQMVSSPINSPSGLDVSDN